MANFKLNSNWSKRTTIWKELRSSILSISSFRQNESLIASTGLLNLELMTRISIFKFDYFDSKGDGSCFVMDLKNPRSVVDLTGPNCDPVYKVVSNDTHVFTCCRDGFIRKYDINTILKNDWSLLSFLVEKWFFVYKRKNFCYSFSFSLMINFIFP